MDRFTESFNEHAELLKEQHIADDHADYNFAIANVDVNVGRQRKHVQNSDIDPLTGKKKKDAIAEALQKTLEDMLLNPQYRLAHENLLNDLRDTQNEAQSAIQRVMGELSIARSAMNDLLSNAAKLPDGTKVFRDKDGQVRNEDGEIIPPELAATIEWKGDEPSYEDYITAKQRINSLEAAERELRGIEAELGDIHERNTRNNDPLFLEDKNKDIERVKEIGERVKEIDNELISNYQAEQMQPDTSQPNISSLDEQSIEIKIPVITVGNRR